MGAADMAVGDTVAAGVAVAEDTATVVTEEDTEEVGTVVEAFMVARCRIRCTGLTTAEVMECLTEDMAGMDTEVPDSGCRS
jgi:hypothetical protein